MEHTLAQHQAIRKAQLVKWPKTTNSEKSAILDAVCGSRAGFVITLGNRYLARKSIRQTLLDQAVVGGGGGNWSACMTRPR